MRLKICDYCDRHPAAGSLPYPYMCAFCFDEFMAFKRKVHAVCAECPTPLSCQISKGCDANKQLSLELLNGAS